MADDNRRVSFGHRVFFGVGGLLAVILTACTQQSPPRQSASAPSLVSLKDGVPAIATALVSGAKLPPPPPSGRYPVVIDPWIDVATNSQVATTKLMQQELESLAPQHFPQLELLPFTPESLTRKPLVILGAIAPVGGPGDVTPVSGAPGAYHVYGVLADLSTGKIASTAGGWVRPQDIDPTPTAFYRDSPVWQGDDSVAAYLRTLQAGSGDPVDAAYLQNLQAEALITSGNADYGDGNYTRARTLYSDAAGLPDGGHQLRVYNGLYLTNCARRPHIGDRGLFTNGRLPAHARAAVDQVSVSPGLNCLLAGSSYQRGLSVLAAGHRAPRRGRRYLSTFDRTHQHLRPSRAKRPALNGPRREDTGVSAAG